MGHDDAAAPLDDVAFTQLPPGYKYKRVMLKISGEALEGEHGFGIDPLVLKRISKEVAEASRSGVEVAIVVGGGNFFRGVNRWDGLDRPTADYVGMLATVMNAITLQSALESEGVEVRECSVAGPGIRLCGECPCATHTRNSLQQQIGSPPSTAPLVMSLGLLSGSAVEC